MEELEVMRAQEEWQRAGAYSVRIQGYPIATCRFYEIGGNAVTIGRVVVLPEYREHHLGERKCH